MKYNFKDKKVISIKFEEKYTFEIGSREFVHEENGLGLGNIIEEVKKALI